MYISINRLKNVLNRINKEPLMGFIGRLFLYGSILLPNSKFKHDIKNYYYRYNNPLYELNLLIYDIVNLEDGIIKIIFINGDIIYCLRDPGKNINPYIQFGIKKKMNKILLLNDPNYFGSLLMMLIENYIFDIYKINSMINEGDFVIDAGANIGIFTILAAKKVGPHGLVVAIEPENKNYEILLKNIEQHELNNIITVKKGLWNTSGTLQLHISDNRGAHSLIDMENYIQNQEIDVITIDDLKKSLKIQNISFIKMDIEGAEIEALKGATETLNQNNLFLVIAAYHIRNGNQTCSIISKDLNMHNFDIISDQQIIIAKKRWIKQKKSNKNNLI